LSAQPKISIITPSFNQGHYIEETILSIIGQGYANLEYIIIDGGSTDDTVAVIKKYEHQITYWVSEKDKGQSDAINKGLKMATGDIVAWLNSDDVYEPGVLQAVADAFAANPKVGIVYGDVESFFPDGRTELWTNNFVPADFFRRVSIHQPAVFWKRSLHETYGYIDESFYYLMDYDFWARIFFNVPSQRINKTLSRFRVHDSAKTGNNPIGLYDDYRRVISRIARSLPDGKLLAQLKQLDVYHNPEDAVYPAYGAWPKEQEGILLQEYLNSYIEQEYTRGHIANTNRLIIQSLGYGYQFGKLKTFIKNTLGIGKIKHAPHAW
jgi:glycosyltransferase involved in cell wall biosynthesis